MDATQETGAPAAAQDKTTRAKEVLGEILRRMGVSATIEAKEIGETLALALTGINGGEELGLREGQRSPVLDALQVIVTRAVNRGTEGKKIVSIELGGFREPQEDDPEIAAMAKRLAEKALAIGKSLAVGPMNSRDRRQVHLALAGVEGIATRSEGEGLARRLLIIPSKKSP